MLQLRAEQGTWADPLVHDLEAKGAALTVLEPTFSTKDAAGPILVTVLGSLMQPLPARSVALPATRARAIDRAPTVRANWERAFDLAKV